MRDEGGGWQNENNKKHEKKAMNSWGGSGRWKGRGCKYNLGKKVAKKRDGLA